MNIYGYSNDNIHLGDTKIEGDLTINGDLLVEGGDVKSDYLDSGTYTPIVSTTTPGWSVGLLQDAVYQKNGNIIVFGVDINLGWTAPTSNPFSVQITVPSVDLFDAKTSIYAYGSGSILGRYSISIVNKLNDNTYNIVFNTADVFTVTATAVVSLILVYKLEGDDVPASVIAVGGGGSGTGEVKNPMIETLNGGGFDLTNIGNVQATTFNGGQILTNPLSGDLNMDEFNINQLTSIQNLGLDLIINVSALNITSTPVNLFGTSTLNMSNNNILNANEVSAVNIQSPVFGGTLNISSPIDLKNNDIKNIDSLTGVSNGNMIISSDLQITHTAPNMVFNGDLLSNGSLIMNNNNVTKITLLTARELLHPDVAGIIDISSSIDIKNNDIKNADTIQVETITSSGFSIEIDKGINQAAPGFDNVLHLRDTATTVKSSAVGYIFIETDDKQGVGAFGAAGDPDYIEIIAYPGRDIQLRVDSKKFDFTSTGSFIMPASGTINTDTLNTSTISAIGDLLINSDPGTSITIGNQARTVYTNTFNTNQISESTQRRTESNSSNLIDTVHIYDVAGLIESTINEGGFNYYQLLDNTTYIIHGEIELTQGFKFGINTAIGGTSTASSITFNESKNNIIGFKATDQNLILQNITIIGGGGHFSDSNVGLIQGANFDTGGVPPLYGRNKRILIEGCNIVAAFSLGKIQGFGTTNLLSNFINGGGGSPTGIYTTFGLDVSDGLSFELRGNKMVLFKGAQASSTTKMVNFVNSTISPVILGINAVIVSGNILHPRDSENAINFEDGALVELGTISANTFIRTGGTEPLINYTRSSALYDNYNYPSIQNFEIVGNAGVINSQPVLSCALGATSSMSSSTFIDLAYTINDMNPIFNTKRFAYKLVMTGLTGSYSAGRYLKKSLGNNKGLIARVDPVVLGTQAVYIVDASQLTGNVYVETDENNVPTGNSSTGFQLGTNSNNFEFMYLEKDEENVQFVLGINFDNDSKEDEIQFRLEFDETGTGNSYIGSNNSTIAALQAKNGRTASATLPFIKRMKYGDLVKLTYRYVDNTDTIVRSVNWTAK